MSGAAVDMACDLPGVTCSTSGGSWWLLGIGLLVVVVVVRRVR
jgi:hypothetical protein